MISHHPNEIIKFILANRTYDIDTICEKLLDWHEIEGIGEATKVEIKVCIRGIINNCGICQKKNSCKVARGFWLKAVNERIYVVHWFCPKQEVPKLAKTKFF